MLIIHVAEQEEVLKKRNYISFETGPEVAALGHVS